MMQFFGTLLFPNLAPDQRRQRMNVFFITLLTILFTGGIIGGAIYLLNTRLVRG
jgi:hypothetical protein